MCEIKFNGLHLLGVINLYYVIALTTHKRNFWQRITDPSTTLSIVPKIEIPRVIFKIE